MDPTKHEVEALLKDVAAVENAVRARAPQEPPLYVALGITIFFIGLAVDLNNVGGIASTVAVILVAAAFAVTVGTNVSYLRRYQQVRTRSTPTWLEWVLGLWGAAAVLVLGTLLDTAVTFSFALGGALGAAPFLLWARQLRRES